MKITSPVFAHNQKIPAKYSCDGDDVNPPLAIAEVPENAKSLVLINDDPDAPMQVWTHWIVWNIPVTSAINEDSVPGIQGKNSWGKNEYGGPCPPAGSHRYFFKLYALDIQLDISEESDKEVLEKAIQGHVLASAELIGLYERI